MSKESNISLFYDIIQSLILMGKRKSSDVATPEKLIRTELTSNSVPHSSWETKRLKIDLIAAKAQITKQEVRVNHQYTIHKEKEILFEKEKASLTKQHERDERALADMDDRLQVIRRRELELRDEYNNAVKEHKEAKAYWDREKTKLDKQVADLNDKLLECNVSYQNQLSEMKRDMDELLPALEGAQYEAEILKKEVAKQTSKAVQCITLKCQLEKLTFELQHVTSKLKLLEYERDSYKDWHQQAKTAQKRLINMAELEKEVIRLRATERSLRDAVCNKLLLEEQVHQLSSTVDALQPAQQNLHEAKLKIASLETCLEEWKAATRSHGVENARELASALDSALTSQLTATAGCSQAQSQLAQLKEVVTTIKYERDKATSKLIELMTVRENQDSLVHRLQKRLQLVSRERDSYRQQLDSYEKEVTVTHCGEAGAGITALLSKRVEQLEKALQGYRNVLATHDQQEHTKLVEILRKQVTKYREEADSLRCDVQKVRTQRDTLHAHMERLDTGFEAKVLHVSDNLAAVAHKQVQLDLEAAQEEIKRLKLAVLEGGSPDVSEETRKLKQQLENQDIKV